MKISYGLATCSAIALALPAAAFAATGAGDLSYNYLGGQIGYASVNPDPGGTNDGLGLGANGSAALLPNVRLVGSYRHDFLDNLGLDLFSLGAGLHTPLNLNTNFRLDAFGDLTYQYINFDPDHGHSNDDSGIGIRGGLRAKFAPNLEADGSIGYVDYGSLDGPVFKFTGLYSLGQYSNTQLTGSFQHYSLDDFNINQLLVGLRFNID